MFSSTIKISSISDYIVPSQECVKPLLRNSKLLVQDELEVTGTNKPDLIKKMTNNKARVSLQDCLACSGCITTAETMLIESHSFEEFLDKVSKAKSPAIGISAQSRASLAHKFQMTDNEMHTLLEEVFKSLNAKLYDLDYYTALALKLSQAEFLNSDRVLISSECPGWVCYAEKTLGPWIIDHMSKVKSGQQLFGLLMKNIHDYRVTIMPCYDKKLESVRAENLGEVDLVLGTREIEEMIVKRQCKPAKLQSSLRMSGNDNPSSNNYLDYILEAYIAFNKLIDYEIKVQERRSDFTEIIISQNGIEIAQFARVYGLKNIANLIQQLRKKTCQYKYVEIMACPSGCMSGGAQIKANKAVNQLKQIALEDKEKPQYIYPPGEFVTSFKHIPKMESSFQW